MTPPLQMTSVVRSARIVASERRKNERVRSQCDFRGFRRNVLRETERKREKVDRPSEMVFKLSFGSGDLILQSRDIGRTAIEMGSRMAADLDSVCLQLQQLRPGQRQKAATPVLDILYKFDL